MKTKLILVLLATVVTLNINAQWVQKAPFPGIARAKAASFTIGNKVYLMGGITAANQVLKDFWEYNITTNVWTQKPQFPGPERYGATAFVMNGSGYIATGGNDNTFLDDMWAYQPLTGTWLQRAGLPANQAQHENQRREAYSFAINNKAYLGGGEGFIFGANQTWNHAFSDLWEYNPLVNGWTPVSGIPDGLGRNFAVGAALNGKGYVGLGCDVGQTLNRTSFWEYDPTTDSWTAKANFPTNFTVDAGSFVIDSLLYIIGGVNLSPVSLSNQFYQYDVTSDTWTALPNFNGGAIGGHFAVGTGTGAITGTGYNSAVNTRSDVWSFGNVTGIEESYLKDEIDVYPNPTNGILYIKSQEEIVDIQISSITGALIASFPNVNQADVSFLEPGSYMIRIEMKNGDYLSRKFIRID